MVVTQISIFFYLLSGTTLAGADLLIFFLFLFLSFSASCFLFLNSSSLLTSKAFILTCQSMWVFKDPLVTHSCWQFGILHLYFLISPVWLCFMWVSSDSFFKNHELGLHWVHSKFLVSVHVSLFICLARD